MAILTGPLMSLDARGKFGGSIVYMGWKGIKSARQLVTPANPQSIAQGDSRLVMGGTGRASGKVGVDSGIHTQLKDLNLIPDRQSKQSYLVQYIIDQYLAGTGATMTAAFVAQLALCTGHTKYTTFQQAATDLDITEFDINYAGISPYDKALGVFLLAKACIALSFTGTPYTLSVDSWTELQVASFTADFAAA